MPRQSPSTDELLANLAWMRALAVRLAPSPGEAEDLTQEAALRALASPSARRLSGPRLRAWLARAVRGLAIDQRRAAERRRRREERSAKPEAQHDVPVDSGSQQLQALAKALLALEEPYRTAILLHYGEGLDGAALARRTGVSPAAVRQRLSRGRARLRTLLGAGEPFGRSQRGMPLVLPFLDLLRPRNWILMQTWKLGGAAALALAVPLTLATYPAAKTDSSLASADSVAPGLAAIAHEVPSLRAPVATPVERLDVVTETRPGPKIAEPTAPPQAVIRAAVPAASPEDTHLAMVVEDAHASGADPASCIACHSNPEDLPIPAGLPDGWTQERDEAGNLLAEGLLELGRRSGLWKEYGEAERLVREQGYRGGREHGDFVLYGEEGQVLARGRYEHGQKAGTWSRWSSSGQLIHLVVFDAGRQDGIESAWWPTGALASETPWSLGLRQGTSRRWHANGQLAEQGHYERGIRAGTWRTWDEQGTAQ